MGGETCRRVGLDAVALLVAAARAAMALYVHRLRFSPWSYRERLVLCTNEMWLRRLLVCRRQRRTERTAL